MDGKDDVVGGWSSGDVSVLSASLSVVSGSIIAF